MRFPACLVLAALAALLAPVLGTGQSVCVNDQSPEFSVWEEGPDVCEGTRFVLANSVEVNGSVGEITLTFAAPLNLQGSQLLLVNPDGSERHLLSDIDEDPCGINATSFTPVDWGEIMASNTFSVTYQLSLPLVGDGVWQCGFRLASDDWGQAVVLAVDLSGVCNLGGGCTNPIACNYDASAQQDDGSCVLPFSSEGCCTTSVALTASLGANESAAVAFEATGEPYAVNAQLSWNNLNLDNSYASDLVVTLSNGNGTCIQFGALVEQPACTGVVSWPNTWSSVQSGDYDAAFSIDLSAVELASGLFYDGTWELEVLNAWPASQGVEVDLALEFPGLCPESGCTDPDACNYSETALADNNTCFFPDCAGVCGGSAEPDACGVCGGPGVETVLEDNPLYELQADGILPQSKPFITYFSGWFQDQILIKVFNPSPSDFASIQLVVASEESEMALTSPELNLTSQGELWFTTDANQAYFDFAPVELLPDDVGGAQLVELTSGAELASEGLPTWTQVSLFRAGVPLDVLGSTDPGEASLFELTIDDVPLAAKQHALARKPFVLWGDPTGTSEANRSASTASTWKVLDENEAIPTFSPAWQLGPQVEVARDCATGDCVNDLNGNGICDELEVPDVPWCSDVNAPNYGPESLTLNCNDPSLIEYFVSSCCDEEEAPAEPLNAGGGLTPVAPMSQALVTGGCGKRASSLAYCLEGQRAFVTDRELKEVRIVDFTEFDKPKPLLINGIPARIDSCPNGNLNWVPTDIDVWNPVPGDFAEPDTAICCSTMVAVTWMDPALPLDSGLVAFYNSDGALIDTIHGVIPTGPDVKAVTFSDDGKWLVTANAGAALGAGVSDDPVGSITAIDVSSYSNTPGSTDFSGITVHQIDFTSLTSVGGLDARMSTDSHVGAYSVAQVLEPTGLAFDPNHHTVWVNCQRNNVLVEVDLDQIVAGTAVQGAWGWGIRNMQATGGINASNNDSPALQPGDNLFGWRQPGDVAVFKYGTNTYAVTANEGAPRPQAASVGTLSGGAYPGLEVDPYYGGGTTPGPGDNIFVYGARSFTLWTLSPGMGPAFEFDSGNELESRLGLLMPDHVNSLESTIQSGDQASSSRGPEPKGVAVGKVGDLPYAFVSLEAMGGVMMYQLNIGDTVPEPGASFTAYASNRFFNASPGTDVCTVGDLGTEDVLYLDKDDTGSGFDAVICANDFTGTLATYGVVSVVPGCTDGCACNFDPFATENDGSCEFLTCAGCTYEDATNYNPSATLEDGTCTFEEACPGDFDNDNSVSISDLLAFLVLYGTSCL